MGHMGIDSLWLLYPMKEIVHSIEDSRFFIYSSSIIYKTHVILLKYKIFITKKFWIELKISFDYMTISTSTKYRIPIVSNYSETS